MTNREWLIYSSDEEIAKWLSIPKHPCNYCENNGDCLPEDYIDCLGTSVAWEKWMGAKHNESI